MSISHREQNLYQVYASKHQQNDSTFWERFENGTMSLFIGNIWFIIVDLYINHSWSFWPSIIKITLNNVGELFSQRQIMFVELSYSNFDLLKDTVATDVIKSNHWLVALLYDQSRSCWNKYDLANMGLWKWKDSRLLYVFKQKRFRKAIIYQWFSGWISVAFI